MSNEHDSPETNSGTSFQDSLTSEHSARPAEEGANLPKAINDLGMILDIPVTLSLELGSTKINIGDLMRLNKGSIVELEKEASEPLEVLVNGKLIAYAEVVVIHDKYGIRFLDVVSESERLKHIS